MKRAIQRGVLAVLVGNALIEGMFLVASGGIEAYVTIYSTSRVPDIVCRVLIVVGTFLCGFINEAMAISVWWLVVGLGLMPFVTYVGLLFFAVLGVGGVPRQAWVVLVPVLVTAAGIAPTLMASVFRRRPAE